MRGHIRKRGEKWSIVYDIGVDANGKRVQKWEGGLTTKREAETKLAQRIAEVENSTFVAPSKQSLASFLEDWSKDKQAQVRPGTWRSYRWNIKCQIIPHLGHVKLQDLTPQKIQRYYSALRTMPRTDGREGNLSERSILHVHLILHQVLERAVRWGLIPRNPCKLVDSPRPKRRELTVWSIEQMGTFLDTAKDDSMYIVFLLLLTTGMRIGEVLGLQWKNVSLDDQSLVVRTQLSFVKGGYVIQPPKTKAGRRKVILYPQVVEELKRHKERQQLLCEIVGEKHFKEHDLVCCTEKGTPLYRGNVTKRWNSYAELSSLPRIRIHDARHSHATHLLALGVNPKVVQERLGHEKFQTIMDTYAHVLPNMQRDSILMYEKELFQQKVSVDTKGSSEET